MVEAVQSAGTESTTLNQEILVLFTAAPHHYVTPKSYTETKPTTAKVIPTWQYATVQAYGRATIYFDSMSETASGFLSKQIDDLSRHTETFVMDYTGKGDGSGPWKVADAPERYIELMKKNIIGIEIPIERLEGKFKMSQEMRKGGREGVIRGFQSLGSDDGQAIAALVQERSDIHEGAGKDDMSALQGNKMKRPVENCVVGEILLLGRGSERAKYSEKEARCAYLEE